MHPITSIGPQSGMASQGIAQSGEAKIKITSEPGSAPDADVAEMERATLVERTQFVLVKARAQGKTLGRPIRISEPQRKEVADLHKQGLSISALSRTYNASRANIVRIVKAEAHAPHEF